MPENLQSFIWLLGLGLIGILLAVVGFLIKDKLDKIMEEMKNFRADVVELFKEDKNKVEKIALIEGKIDVINERCKERDCGVKS